MAKINIIKLFPSMFSRCWKKFCLRVAVFNVTFITSAYAVCKNIDLRKHLVLAGYQFY